MDSSLRVIVTGLIATHRYQGGVAWDYLNFVLGMKRLGHDVYYLEDTGGWPYNLDGGDTGDDLIAYDPKPTVEYLASVMDDFGLTGKWAYHFPTKSEWFGLPEQKRKELLQSADLLINVSGTLERPEKYRQVKKLVYIDTDPVFTQIKAAGADTDFRGRVNAHDVHFTFGECLGKDLPDTGHHWHPTRQPIVLGEWFTSAPYRNTFTTVMNWTSYDVATYGGRTYGQKDLEFVKFASLPKKVSPTTLEVALHKALAWPVDNEHDARSACGSVHHSQKRTPHEILKQFGWRIIVRNGRPMRF